MCKKFMFNPRWNGRDDIGFHTEVKLMDRAFYDWPSLDGTKMMEAKMPPELVAEMKYKAAHKMSMECAPDDYIARVLRLPEWGIPTFAPDEEEPEDFPEKESRRASRRKAEIKARRRKAQISEIQKRRKAKQDKDREIYYFSNHRRYACVSLYSAEFAVHDKDLWKPLDKQARLEKIVD